MADKLLINVAHEETRVALVESGRLANFEIITSRADNNKGNIYKGIVHRVNTSLQAAFVDYGAEKQGFLPLPEIHDRFYPPHLVGKKVSIQDVLRQGQEIMVQVVKDEIGQKGAGLTTFISVAGRSLAIEANSDKAGISRRVSDDERKRLKKVMGSLDVPDGHGAIMRTAAADQTDDAIQENHRYLMIVLNKLNERFAAMKGPGLVHQERGLAVRFIRDYVPSNIDEVLIDDREAWEEVKNFCTVLAPELVSRVKLYDDPRPLFSRYQVEDQIDDIFARRIDLPSGGSIVIDQTEALVAIDVNSGRVKTDDIEDTALKTNLEAAAEVARQLKIRDRGGLIVVDFIDMRDKDNIRKVEDAVREGFRSDKAKVKFSKISEFGLMEISRQRLQGSVMRGSFTPCGTCGGTGQVRSVESSALYLLRRMKETLIRGNYQHLDAQMPVAIANYLLNRKRKELVDLEKQTGTSIEVRAEDAVPAMQSYFELISRSANQARRPKRIMQRIDLVRSEVEKRELEEGEELVIETESSTDEAEASVFAAARKKLEGESKTLEAELARSKELEKAQQEADESLRREAELRAQRELEEARRETIRTLEEARWKGMSIWGRLKAFFGGGLPPLELPGEGGEPEREDKKRRDRR
ncbi:MAG TPA: Rne/Rng family ribonuclease, partial [Myxococcota bacterium]|nr:Rne/Rng family ribonuclease [Myxococcota bacterium]